MNGNVAETHFVNDNFLHSPECLTSVTDLFLCKTEIFWLGYAMDNNEGLLKAASQNFNHMSQLSSFHTGILRKYSPPQHLRLTTCRLPGYFSKRMHVSKLLVLTMPHAPVENGYKNHQPQVTFAFRSPLAAYQLLSTIAT